MGVRQIFAREEQAERSNGLCVGALHHPPDARARFIAPLGWGNAPLMDSAPTFAPPPQGRDKSGPYAQ